MTAVTAIATDAGGGLAGRPPVEVPGRPGVFVVGDWVGPWGHLADAVLASAADAARAAVAQPRRAPGPAVTGRVRGRGLRGGTPEAGRSRLPDARHARRTPTTSCRTHGCGGSEPIRGGIDDPAAWLTTVTTRLAIDRARLGATPTRGLRRSVAPRTAARRRCRPGRGGLAPPSRSRSGSSGCWRRWQPVERAVFPPARRLRLRVRRDRHTIVGRCRAGHPAGGEPCTGTRAQRPSSCRGRARRGPGAVPKRSLAAIVEGDVGPAGVDADRRRRPHLRRRTGPPCGAAPGGRSRTGSPVSS